MNDHVETFTSDLTDALTARLAKIMAIANVLMGVNPAGMARNSLSNNGSTE